MTQISFDFEADVNAIDGEHVFAAISVGEKYMRVTPAIKNLSWDDEFQTEAGVQYTVGDVVIDLNAPNGTKSLKSFLSSHNAAPRPLILILPPPAYETGGIVGESKFKTAGERGDRVSAIITGETNNMYSAKPCVHAVSLDKLAVSQNHQTGALEIRFSYGLSTAPIELPRNYQLSLAAHQSANNEKLAASMIITDTGPYDRSSGQA